MADKSPNPASDKAPAELLGQLEKAMIDYDSDLIAGNLFQAAHATIVAQSRELIQMQEAVWSTLKDRRDYTMGAAREAQMDLDEAIKRGWDSHLPTADEVLR